MIGFLSERLLLALPGKQAQAKMAHIGRIQEVPPPPNARIAAVLILLYEKNAAWHTVLMRRASRFGHDKHKGQISFPGGQAEAHDTDHASTALREAQEELGIPSEDVRLLGALTDLYIPVSNFLVYPNVGYIPYPPVFMPDEKEVAEVIETPLSRLWEEGQPKSKNLKTPSGLTLRNVPYFDVRGHVVWGATSMIISELLEVLDKPVVLG